MINDIVKEENYEIALVRQPPKSGIYIIGGDSRGYDVEIVRGKEPMNHVLRNSLIRRGVYEAGKRLEDKIPLPERIKVVYDKGNIEVKFE